MKFSECLSILFFFLVLTSCTKEVDKPPLELYGSWDVITKIYENPDGSEDYTRNEGKGGTIWTIDEESINYDTTFGTSGLGFGWGEAYKYHDGEINLFLSGRHKLVDVNNRKLHLIKVDEGNGNIHLYFERYEE
ncbi:hypothetical protein [Salegentibacter mishustinae]|uniref:Lipocalin-like domain-containing protein n=1 Tax=Salegentibacter mishustinae TaxID=270918 RepID=A0A0Q9ZIK4_9FLAO|nr:hypothetical protein [Salegentibacter mishustinae]KRG28631.1 hypothetical protein APR42_07610 [Salegentibacter mishustinae]PNW22561.1 hypothetical protein APB85_15370 [Salegentibacter mishustinae]PZX67808.1 hypothetical protein LY54_00546 [Salegentibacter mishustinae]GGW77224.1 hypothetical protein GCM10008086_00700 [Salegentibacter mishustinae]